MSRERLLLLLVTISIVKAEGVFEETITLVADRLVELQNKDTKDPNYGSWSSEEWATGSIVTGLASAYERTEDPNFRIAAIRGGINIVATYAVNHQYYGDGGYAIMMLNEKNIGGHAGWEDSLRWFYELVESIGTEQYLEQYTDYDPTMAIFDLSHHVISTHALDMPDKEIWRNYLRQTLGQVDDEDDFPVMALALSLWAFAETDLLDDTLIDDSATDLSYWYGKTLKDLPRMLLEHKVPDEEPDEGAYFWKFNHLGGPEDAIVRSGYTEDVVYACLAWLTLYNQYIEVNGANNNEDPGDDIPIEGTWLEVMDPNLSELHKAITQAENVLLNCVHEDGSVSAHVLLGAQVYNVFAGEVLHAICQLEAYEDEIIEN